MTTVQVTDKTPCHPRDSELWEPRYGIYDRELTERRLRAAADALRRGSQTDNPYDEDFDTTLARIHHAFDLFEGLTYASVDAPFAFVVPGRLTRDEHSTHNESDNLLPFMRHLDAPTKQIIWSGMCPFLLDVYGQRGATAGAMVVVPLTADIASDLPFPDAVRTSHDLVRDALVYCRDRLGTSLAGLGALLPKLTNFGRSTSVSGLTTTTGHGGTVALITEMCAALGSLDGRQVSIVGTGSIGRAAAGMLIHEGVGTLTLFDAVPSRALALAERLQSEASAPVEIRAAGSLAEALKVNLVVAATTSSVCLEGSSVHDLSGTTIIDDSQPACFDRAEVESRGGQVLWVVGRDNSPEQSLTKLGYWGSPFDYGGSGPASPKDVWGCEAEVHALSRCGVASENALTGPVTTTDVTKIREYLRTAGTGLAPWQSHGSYR